MKEAWFSDAKGARGDFSFIDIDFWNLTQGDFLTLVRELENGQQQDERLGIFFWKINQFARDWFDNHVFTNPYESSDLQRCMAARKKLITRLAGKSSKKAASEKKQEAVE